MPKWDRVELFTFGDDSSTDCAHKCTASISINEQSGMITVANETQELYTRPYVTVNCMAISSRKVLLRPKVVTNDDSDTAVVCLFKTADDAVSFLGCVHGHARVDVGQSSSIFDARTEETSASQYFQFYGYLSQQQNMMQDYVRTSTYQRAILSNASDFKDKVVLDVGAGSGILSFFAVQAGARKVYAVEASTMAKQCQALVAANNLSDKIVVIPGKIEEITLPELVDTIISEPMGYMLLNERMIESYLHAKKFLRPESQGRMFPSRGDLYMSPFSDEALYMEQANKSTFWTQTHFHGVNLTSLREEANHENYRQPIVDTWHVGILLAKEFCWPCDFQTTPEQSLHNVEMEHEFVLDHTAHIHGLAFWFDVAFIGSTETVWLSTAPTEPLTHWYQVRCMLRKPIMGVKGQICRAKVKMVANQRQSYDVDIEVACNGEVGRNTLDLKNPYFRYNGQPVQPPAGFNTGPTGPGAQAQTANMQYWTQMAQMQQQPIDPNTGVYAAVPPANMVSTDVTYGTTVNGVQNGYSTVMKQ